jgi:hypothetical protein
VERKWRSVFFCGWVEFSFWDILRKLGKKLIFQNSLKYSTLIFPFILHYSNIHFAYEYMKEILENLEFKNIQIAIFHLILTFYKTKKHTNNI